MAGFGVWRGRQPLIEAHAAHAARDYLSSQSTK